MIKSRTTKVLALLLTAILILPVANISVAAPLEGSVNDTYDTYFNDVYDSLADTDHVFQTLTYHELDYLLDSEGTYVVLFGGAWDEDTQSAIGYINEIAKASGVKAIHNFDPRLDGQTIDITDNDNNPYTRRYVEIVSRFLTNLDDHVEGTGQVSFTDTVVSGRAPNQTTKVIEGTAVRIETPFLFVYNRDHKNEADDAPILASLAGIDALLTDGRADAAKADAYKELVEAVFAAIPGEADVLRSNDYIPFSYNEFSRTAIFDETDGEIVIEPVTYDELLHILESEGNYVFIFGCSWCGNTQAVIKFVNQYAKAYQIDAVYNWDTKLDGGIGGTPGVEAGTDSSNFLQTRATEHPYANVYVDLVRKYLPNIETLYDIESNNVSYTDSWGYEVTVNKLQVPYVFLYNKDHKDESGNPAPIVGHVELMYTWTNIQPEYESNGKVGVNYNNYTQELDRLFSTLHGLQPQDAPTGLTGKAPSSDASRDGEIAGTSAALEYKRAEDRRYAPVQGDALSGLAQGTYYVRYAAKEGFKPSPAAIIDLNLAQVAPTGLTGAAPASSANDDGRIAGTTLALEYRLPGEERFTPATEPFVAGLAAGTYEVRAKARYGYDASPTVDVVVPPYAGVSFADVAATAWYNKAVSILVNSGIASGSEGNTFSPNAPVTKGQLVQWFLRGYQLEAGQIGVAGEQLASGETIARQDLFKLLYDALGAAGKLPAAGDSVDLSVFSDADQIAGYAVDAVKAFVESGVIVGSNAELNPAGLTTRAEAAQILYSLLSK